MQWYAAASTSATSSTLYAAAVVALGLLSGGGLVLRRRRRRSRAAGPRAGGARANDTNRGASSELPVFDVVALGPRGSGKTLLLASMYHELQTASARGYHLSAPFEQVVALNQWFGEAADPSREWPAGTAVADSRSFLFTVQTRTPSGRPLPVLGLRYLEYAGGLLTDPQAPGSGAQRELVERIQQAHALIGIIDGFWVRRWMDGDGEARVRLQQTVTTMITLMLYAPGPITFVITKWDLLSDLGPDDEARLQFVRQALMLNPGFRDLVLAHSARRVVRLIPVSAVGPAFAALDEAGRVTKRPDGEIRPSNIDVPLAAVVPDLWQQIQRSVEATELRDAVAALTAASGRTRLAALTELGSLFTEAAGKVLGHLAPPAGLVLDLATAFETPDLDERIADSLRADRQLSDTERELEANRFARQQVLRQLQSRVDVLEGRLPSSRLGVEA